MDGFFVLVDADPLSVKLFCGGERGAATAVWVKHDVTFGAGRFDDAFEQSYGFLCRVTGTFFGACDRDICPAGADEFASVLVCVLAFIFAGQSADAGFVLFVSELASV